MKSQVITALSFFSATSIAGITLIHSEQVQAAVIPYYFRVSIESGDLAPSFYDGSFTFDTSLVSNTGTTTLTNINGITILFPFLGTNYTEDDDSNASIEFQDGQVLGLSFSVSGATTFSFSPAIPGVLPAEFTYSLTADNGGGSVLYAPSTIPEPNSLWGLGAVGILGLTLQCLRTKPTSFKG